MKISKKFIVFCTAICIAIVVNTHSHPISALRTAKISSSSVVTDTTNSFSYSEKSITILKNNVEQVLPSNSKYSDVSYSSSNPSVATVDINGNIFGLSNGCAIITATNENDVSTTIEVNVTSFTLVLDPGHGNRDTGTEHSSTYEKNIDLDIAKSCKNELDKYCGISTFLTRTDDTFISLTDRAIIAKNKGANLLISMHVNASSAHIDKGALIIISESTYKPTYNKESSILANCILDRLSKYGFSNKGLVTRLCEDETYAFDGSKADYYGVIRHCIDRDIPSIIIEHGFIDSSDFNLLNTNKKRTAIGIADANGVADYLKLKKASATTKDSVFVTKLELNTSKKVLSKGDSFNISTKVFPLIANNTKLSYASSNTSVATIDNLGKVTAVAAGNSTITVSTTDGSNLSDSFNIKVK